MDAESRNDGAIGSADQALTGASLVSDHQQVAYIYNSWAGTACTGTLIDVRTLLTAAHCLNASLSSTSVNKVSSNDIEVYFDGNMTSFSGKRRYDAAELVEHPDFAGGGHSDLGLVILDEDVDWLTPYSIADQPPVVGDELKILGYGMSDSSYYRMRQMGTNTVASVLSETFAFTPDTGSGVCPGDSGGPSLIVENGTAVVAGVHSGSDSPSCGQGNGFDMRVDVFHDWIVGNAYGDGGGSGSNGTGTVDPGDYSTGGCSAGGRTRTSLFDLSLLGLVLLALRMRRRAAEPG